MPAASLCEAMVELVEVGALLEAVRGLELKVDGRVNERRVRIRWGALEKNLQELITDLTKVHT